MSVRDARGRPLKTLAAWQVAILIKSLPCLMEPRPFGAGVFGEHFFAGRGAENDESIEVRGRARQAFILKARRGRDAGGRDLPKGRDQPGDLGQLEETVSRSAAGRDVPVEGTKRRERPPENDRRRPDLVSGNAARHVTRRKLVRRSA